jgi:hypothetical protein
VTSHRCHKPIISVESVSPHSLLSQNVSLSSYQSKKKVYDSKNGFGQLIFLLSLLSLFCGSVVAKTYQSKEHA